MYIDEGTNKLLKIKNQNKCAMLIKWECNVNEMRIQCWSNENAMLTKWEYKNIWVFREKKVRKNVMYSSETLKRMCC